MAVGGYADSATVVAVCVTMSTIAAAAVAMRIYARFAIAKNAGWDDGFIVFSSANSWVLTSTAIWLVKAGMGKHEADLSYSEAEENLKALWTSIIIYNLGLTCTKMSILLQYQRIFPQRGFRIANWTMMLELNGPTTANRFASAGLNIATDIAITILPLPLLNKLEIPKRQKRTLIAVFGLGGVVCIISILRLYAIYVVWNSQDVSHDNGMASIWSNLEFFRNRSYGSARRSPGASREVARNSWSAKLEYGARFHVRPPVPSLDREIFGHEDRIDLATVHAKRDGLDTAMDDNQRPASPTDSLRGLVRKPAEVV
ncbi:uncharacterized protein MYCFIDRAFT_212887 [Pseudocercospora fijiensis CIRAD86]|uniref:Rhodopsin domain-containing protein n=1 Tax=Pseudocercospora fijiensis (strain CIRAD86) TaxID=383855 RepID=N1Q981_PSEFD|nr:uncharacterized protein MYCFIDRAFT_212887 [Pseudocercospora fijiensis CIRAD86]EME87448.1 hypothetical protein MYCFIDRAFT_212887 [Pseudocercospora fijiensis CIRAD86]